MSESQEATQPNENQVESFESLRNRLEDGRVLRAWAGERTLLSDNTSQLEKVIERYTTRIGAEKNARLKIVSAIRKDFDQHDMAPRFPLGYPDMLVDSMWPVDKAQFSISDTLEGLRAWKESDRLKELKTIQSDTVTGEQITAEVTLEQDQTLGSYWVARETGSDGRLITEAKIRNGLPKDNIPSYLLTLNFTGDRFEIAGKEANPKIVESPDMPITTATTFDLLARHVMDRAVETSTRK